MRKSESPSNRLSPRGRRTIQYIVTNGAIVIHTQRLKSDPGGNLL
ncbi:methyl-accepting chemotaxis protein II, partial [Yersinia pestis PY-72]